MKHLRYAVTGLAVTLAFLVVLLPLILVGAGGAVLVAVLWDDLPVVAVLVGILTLVAVMAGTSWLSDLTDDDAHPLH